MDVIQNKPMTTIDELGKAQETCGWVKLIYWVPNTPQ